MAWATFALPACSDVRPPEQPEASAGGRAFVNGAQSSLYGRWRIVEVNGAPARALSTEPALQPSVTFGPDRYGGSSGCNSFGGSGLLVGDRWFAEPPMATQQGCGELTAQEEAVFGIVAGGPAVTWDGGPDSAMLRTAAGTLRLSRMGVAPEHEGSDASELMAGRGWELFTLDGAAVDLPGARQPASLAFEADRWTLETPCAVHRGTWRQMEGEVLLDTGTSAPRACGAEAAPADEALADAVAGRMAYVIGPNGELVLASADHWVTGRRDATFGEEGRGMLSGRWRIVSADGASPPGGGRPAELLFGPGAFAVWDGCRHSEGVAMASERQLFTHGSGVVTLANCPPDEIRRKINAVVAASPRIALTADDGVALVSRAGTLRLERTSARAFGTGVETRLQPGTAFAIGATGLPARLTVGPGDRFTVSLPCGTFEGRWRNARGPNGDHARFGPERPPPGCAEEPAAMRLYNFFTGDVLVAVGPNRDIALFVSNGQGLAARVANPSMPGGGM